MGAWVAFFSPIWLSGAKRMVIMVFSMQHFQNAGYFDASAIAGSIHELQYLQFSRLHFLSLCFLVEII